MTPFINDIDRVIEQHLCAEGFGVAELAQAVGLSRVQVHRRVVAVWGVSPGVLIRRRRLARAARLLEARVSVTEVVYRVGWNSLSHFAKVFRRHYGVVPSVYAAG